MKPPTLIDIGANLTHKSFRGDLAAVLERALGAGVGTILVTGTSAPSSRLAWQLAVDRRAGPSPRLFATAGVHPHQASTLSPALLEELDALVRRPEVVAVGECGLDYDRDFSPRDRQRAALDAQLDLAAAVGKPVFLHEREAHEDFARALERARPKLAGGVVHCFTGSRAAMERYLALDLHIGITGWICDERRGKHLRELVKLVPRGRLLVETDAPFLFPRDLPDHRKHGRNEPALLDHVASTVARCRGEPLAELAEHTTAAAEKLFRLPPARPA
ncbi:MAG: TatD family hydrolase [Byssovorax sp.]